MPLDRVVIAGLDEGRWPPDTSSDPWLSRPMRRKLGLDLPERRIGLSAHDFAQGFGAPEVVLTRARKAGGAPTVPARFLQRLAAVAGEAWSAVETRGERILALARMVDAAPPARPVARPMPAPPLALRPQQLSVTEIEDFIRDPYTIYARHVLRLTPLDPLDADVSAPARGTIVHEALAEFLKAYPERLPPDALARLIDFGRAAFARIDGFPDLRAVWWPRFERVARWLVAEERARRAELPVRSLVELGGKLTVPGTDFLLTGRADRIDLTATGAVSDRLQDRPAAHLQAGRERTCPQLPLEAAMVSLGGFADVPAGTAIDGLAMSASRAASRPANGSRSSPRTPLSPTSAPPRWPASRGWWRAFAIPRRAILAWCGRVRPAATATTTTSPASPNGRRAAAPARRARHDVRHPATRPRRDQAAASDPARSAWVDANAGSGKTHVLARRVVRLLLRGTPPDKLLCLTFTKAAAANMANRVLAELGGLCHGEG